MADINTHYNKIILKAVNAIHDEWQWIFIDIDFLSGSMVAFGRYKTTTGTCACQDFKMNASLMNELHDLHDRYREEGYTEWNKVRICIYSLTRMDVTYSWVQVPEVALANGKDLPHFPHALLS